MTGVQVFLMAFGAVLTIIGIIVFFLLAWFKEATGQDHHNAIKILQAEFRFSNPALVIFAGGLLLMVAPFFLGQAVQNSPSPAPASVALPTPVPQPPAEVRVTPAAEAAAVVIREPTLAPVPTRTPTPTPTATPVPPAPVFTSPDPTGRWRNPTGFLEFRRLGVDQFAYSDFDSFGNAVGQGTATQDDENLYLSGEGFLVDGFGNPVFITYTGEMVLTGNVLEGDLYDSFGNFLGSVLFTRDAGGVGR